MYDSGLQSGLITHGSTPPAGWHIWAQGVRPSERWRRCAGVPLPDRVDVVRSVQSWPAEPIAGGPTCLCVVPAHRWPVAETERQRLRATLSCGRALYADATDEWCDCRIRADDPDAGYAAAAPLTLSRNEATYLGAQSLHSGQHTGALRWTPDAGGGWQPCIGWGSTLRQLGRPLADPQAALDQVVASLSPIYRQAAEALRQKMGGSIDWGGITAARGITIRIVDLRSNGHYNEEAVLRDDVYIPLYRPPVIPIQPVNRLDDWAGTDDVPCPDCGGHIVWNEGGYVPGWRTCSQCGGHWRVEIEDEQVVLRRQICDDDTWRGVRDDDEPPAVECPPISIAPPSDADKRIEAATASRRAGKARRKAEITKAINMLAECPAIAPLIDPRRAQLTRQRLALRNGMTVDVLGPVRLRDGGAAPLALVRDVRRDEEHGRTYWMAIGSFA